MEYNIIVATDSEGGISKGGVIPWNFQEDKNFFIDQVTRTTGLPNIIVSGRKTFEQMGAFSKHINVVISTTFRPEPSDKHIYVASSIEAFDNYLETLKPFNEIFICGGKSIYKVFLKRDCRLIHTYISRNYMCDNNISDILETNIFLWGYDSDRYKAFKCRDLNYLHIPSDVDTNIKCIHHNRDPDEVMLYFRVIPYQNKGSELRYLKYLDKLLTKPIHECRNGKTRSNFGGMLKFNLDEGFPLLTTKRVFLRGIFEELMFFIRGETDTNLLSQKGVKIWEQNTTRSFIDQVGLNLDEGSMGPMYGYQWRSFNSPMDEKGQRVGNEGIDQLMKCISLILNDPYSRRIVMTSFNPLQVDQGVLYPCHGLTVQFSCSAHPNGGYYLHIAEYQRSCDYFLGLPFNIASYALLSHLMCHHLNALTDVGMYHPGKVIIHMGDYHLYEEHLIQAQRQLLRTPCAYPTLSIRPSKTRTLMTYEYEDLVLDGYTPWNTIQAKMIA
jgi:thymidylate synthase